MAINDKLLSGASADGGLVPSENFNTVLYTGTNVTQSITNVGFEPDLIWFKNRTGTNSHAIVDSVRTRAKYLYPDDTFAENTSASDKDLVTFDTNGFTLGPTSQAGSTNISGGSIVAWCWKAGGTKALNEEGTIDSQVSANTAAGFSVVEWTGDTNSTATVGHGLSSPPDLYFLKGLDNSTDSWIVSGSSAIFSSPLTNFLRLNTSDLIGNTASGHVGSGSTTINVGVRNYNTQKSIAYCFHSVAEYSKVGTYEGTFLAGNDVECGFEPAWVMIKNADATGNWIIVDNKRNPTNEKNKFLYPNENAAEGDLSAYDTIDFTTTGFVLQDHTDLTGTTNINISGQTYIFYAVAADPDTTTPTVAKSFDIHTYTGNGGTQQIGSVNTLFTKYAVFNGSSSVFDTNVSVPTNWTVSLWLNRTPDGYFGGTTNASVRSGVYFYISSNGTLQVYNRNSTGGNIDTLTTSTGLVSEAHWHHIAITFDSTSGTGLTTVYVDGTSAGTLDGTPTHSTDFKFGRSGDYATEYFNGKIDQVRIYNTAINQTAVTSLYNETQASASTKDYPSGTGCIALYEFNDNVETTPSSAYNGTESNITYDSFLFKPDLVIIKNLTYSGGSSWSWADTLRGVSNDLRSDGNYANRVDAGYRLTGFNDTGFSVTDVANGDYGVNGTPAGTYTGDGTYIAYSFKMLDNNNNVPVENEVGQIDSLVSANPSAGMSIVRHTSTNNNNTIGHGLSSAPQLIISKNLDLDTNWGVYSSATGLGKYMYLNLTDASPGSADANVYPAVSATTFAPGGSGWNNGTGKNYIHYCFHSVTGFSSIGGYTGNTSTYPTVSTGFQPDFVMIKRTDSGDNWLLFDTKRDTSNPTNIALIPNSTAPESVGNLGNGITLGSDGFVLNSTDTGINANTGTYLYWAMKIN